MEAFHAWIGARQAFCVNGQVDIWMVFYIACKVTGYNFALKESVQQSVW